MNNTPHHLEVALIELIQDMAESFGVTVAGTSSQTQLKSSSDLRNISDWKGEVLSESGAKNKRPPSRF